MLRCPVGGPASTTSWTDISRIRSASLNRSKEGLGGSRGEQEGKMKGARGVPSP